MAQVKVRFALNVHEIGSLVVVTHRGEGRTVTAKVYEKKNTKEKYVLYGEFGAKHVYMKMKA